MYIEVAYAEPAQQYLVTLELTEGSTVEDAILASGLLVRFPGIDLAVNKVGIFGRACPLSTVLREKDRVEIYRPLLADPKVVRRERVAAGKTMKKANQPD
ncbi:RnfH family protein [Chitinimonas sp. PSY-7]|uniref:RnfH family protein n=1 Tax=Chitinimonas sp. PSY-7 TaxID=3459088 RepID=UPI0040401776